MCSGFMWECRSRLNTLTCSNLVCSKKLFHLSKTESQRVLAGLSTHWQNEILGFLYPLIYPTFYFPIFKLISWESAPLQHTTPLSLKGPDYWYHILIGQPTGHSFMMHWLAPSKYNLNFADRKCHWSLCTGNRWTPVLTMRQHTWVLP